MHTRDDRRKLAVPREENYQCNPENVNPRLGLTSRESSIIGDEPNEVFNSDSSWRNSLREQNSSGGQGTPGKVLEHLRDLHQAHLDFVDKHQHLLETQLVQSTEYRDKIAKEMNRLEEKILGLLGEEQSEQIE
jgi:hypothetical protein